MNPDLTAHPVINPGRADGIRQETPARPGAPTTTREVETTMVDANTVAAPADPGLIRRFEGFLAQDARELEIADAELRHVVNLLVASQEENAALRAELAAANDAVLELLQDLEIAQSGRDTSNGAGGSVRGVR